MSKIEVARVYPSFAVEGGRVTISGHGLSNGGDRVPEVFVRDRKARVVLAGPDRVAFLIPEGIVDAGLCPIRVGASDALASIEVAAPVATGLHQVDSPIVDRDGNLYFTYSGTRGQQVPVSIFRVGPSGTRETYATGIVNPTSLAFDSQGRLYVSSRFEGTVYRVNDDGAAEPFATDLGVACGLAFGPDDTLYVGDRSGTIFAVDRRGDATTFASLPGSVAAFHLALSDDALFVSGPTLSTYDPVYRIDLRDREAIVHSDRFGRPQGLAVAPDGSLYVVEALAGVSGLFRVASAHAEPELILAGPSLIGVAFDREGGLVVCSSETAYRLPRRH